ncbi:formyltransferase family protein [Halomarina rubra]|uniref:Formyltransferase family protein n=1 Tax=Halomarina rubra TaxID=2071873 RepID=A0ABD6B0V6_9EURY
MTITSIVYNEYEDEATRWETLQRAIELREWAVVATLNNVLLESDVRGGRVPIEAVVDRSTAEEYSVNPDIVDGWKQSIPQEAVDEIATNADVAVRFGFGFLVGPILTGLPYGVLSYHHGDLREYRGQPMGFWEFVHGQPTAGITVQQLTEKLDGGGIAASKTIPIDDLRTWEAVKRRLFAESEDMLLTAVETLQNDAVQEPEALGDLYTLPKGRPVATFALKNTGGHLLNLATPSS